MAHILSKKSVYVQSGPLGFLCDSEWDGDSFTKDPLSAWHYDKPVKNGRYDCCEIIITDKNFGDHVCSNPIKVQTKSYTKGPKVKWKVKCQCCGRSTKNYATPEMAQQRYNENIMPSDCIVSTWEYANIPAKEPE